jgi:hypothetical protein
LVASACDGTGCSCNSYVTCDVSMSISTSSTCNPGTILKTMRVEERVGAASGEPPTMEPCEAVTPTVAQGFYLNSVNYVSARCAPGGSETPAAPAWMTSGLFCASARTSSTCTSASQVCAPRPPTSEPLCVRVPSTDASCPAGYTTGTNGNWYANYSDNRACTCDCNSPTDAACGTTLTNAMSNNTACPIMGTPSLTPGLCQMEVGTCSYAGAPLSNTCILLGNNPTNTVGVSSVAVSGQCGVKGDTSGTAMPTEGSTICCQ